MVFLLALLSYLPSVWGEFVFDDAEAILKNEDVTSNTSIWKVFSDDFWGVPIAKRSSHKSYRPLTVMTYQLNYWLAGGRKPLIFHLTNVLLHPIVALVYMAVCQTLVQGDLVGGRGHSGKCGRGRHVTSVSVIAGAMFAVHPVHTESVSTLL